MNELAVTAITGVGVRLLCVSYVRINSVASIPPIIVHCGVSGAVIRAKACRKHKYDVKRPILSHARFERVHSKRPVLHNLDCVPVFQEDLDDHLLVHEVVFSEQDSNFTSFVGLALL